MPELRINERTPFYQINRVLSSGCSYEHKGETLSIFEKLGVTFQTTSYERYAGLDLSYYYRAMDTSDFKKFIQFIGEENIGVQEEDFDIYYPED